MFLVLKRFGLSDQGKLRNSFLTIETQRTCNVFLLSIVGAKATTAKFLWVLSVMSPLLEFGPQRLSEWIPNLCGCVFDPCFWRYFNSDDVISFSVTRVQRKQISCIRWYGRALVISW